MIEKYEVFITTTDTLIGIGAKINPENLKTIYNLKKRPIDKKIIIVVGSIQQLEEIEKISLEARTFITKYWPGSTTLIINNNSYRMPNQKGLINLTLQEGPFYLTSANISGQESAKSIEEAKIIFPSINKIYNFGNGSNIASSIIDTKDGRKLR